MTKCQTSSFPRNENSALFFLYLQNITAAVATASNATMPKTTEITIRSVGVNEASKKTKSDLNFGKICKNIPKISSGSHVMV